jgi:hypothetical protein
MRDDFRGDPVSSSTQPIQVENDLKHDPRWQLIERILATAPFKKSGRLRELLPYIAERSILGYSDELTEHNIGIAVFGKAADYSPVDDSSVRVHARQLRLKLHEYFDGEGRGETMIVEIPKGSYAPVFRGVRQVPADPAPSAQGIAFVPPLVAVPQSNAKAVLPWAIVVLLAIACLILAINQFKTARPIAAPWPLSNVFDGSSPAHVVIADVNYGMLRIISQQGGSLEEYLRPNLQQSMTPPHLSEREARVMNYISSSNLTSYADVVVATTLLNMAPDHRNLVSIRSARDLRLRDLEDGNYVFVGSPGSNPWVSLYQNRLNFTESEGVVGGSMKYFVNEHPLPGEQKTYRGLEFTGSAGEDYATISLLPTGNGHGSVLLLQGLQQEGTEAAGLFLADAGSRQKLKEALHLNADPGKPVHFEVLIRTRAVAGTPNTTSIVAARIIP